MSSCEDFFETTIELEEPPFVEQLVINSILTNQTLDESRALVSKTIGLNDDIQTSLVSDAEVKIIFPDQSSYILEYIESVNYYQGYNYEGQLPEFVENQDYTIEVSRGAMTVRSTATMPKSSNLISAVYMENGGLNEEGDEVSAIDIIIDDEAGVQNYYKIGAEVMSDGFANPLYIDSNNAFALASATYEDLIINDEQFDGEDFKLRLQFYNFDSYYGGEPIDADYRVTLRSISKEQYDHDRLLYGFFENNDNPFASPVQLPSNIENGLGLFTLENITIIDVTK